MTNLPARPAALALLGALAAQEPPPLQLPAAFDPQVRALCVVDRGADGPLLVVAGETARAASPLADHVTVYDPATGAFAPLGRGTDGPVWALCPLPDGGLAVGGDFRSAGGVPAENVARWDGTAWHGLGNGVGERDASFETVRALVRLADGSLVAGGRFAAAGAGYAAHVGVFRDGRWQDVGRGVAGTRAVVRALAALDKGAFVAAGEFEVAGGGHARNIARWDGAAWEGLGAGNDGVVHALLVLPGGDLLAAGEFEVAGGQVVSNVARFCAGGWQTLGAGVGRVECLARLPGGDVLAGLRDGGVARWDGTSWHEVADLDARVLALAVLPDGTVFAGGDGLYRSRGGGWVTLLPERARR